MTEHLYPAKAVAALREELQQGGGPRIGVYRIHLASILDYAEARRWRPIESAPRDGSAFLGYGVHDHDAPLGASREVKAGDHWWGIILWDIWRGAPKFVFSKDGAATWSAPTYWRPLPPPPDREE